MEKKYKFTDETKRCGSHVLHRIRAVRDFGDVHKGDLGGFIESEYNLSHDGNCWVYDNAKVFGNGKIYDNVIIRESACVYGDAKAFENARIRGNADIRGHAWVMDNAEITDNSKITGGRIIGNAYISKDAYITSSYDYIIIENAGTRSSTTTFYRCTEGIRVNCELFAGDCFNFTLKECETYIKENLWDEQMCKRVYEIYRICRILSIT